MTTLSGRSSPSAPPPATPPPNGTTAAAPPVGRASVPDGWQRAVLPGPPRRDVLVRQLAGGGREVVPAQPRLSTSARPELVVLLRRVPDATTPDVTELVDGGSLAMTVSLDVAALPSGSRPVFATRVHVTLVAPGDGRGPSPRSGERVLAEADGAGPDASIALAGVLDRDDALAVAAAARGEGGLVVRAELEHSGDPSRSTLTVSVDLGAVARALADVVRPLTRADLAARLSGLLATGAAKASLDDVPVDPQPVDDVAVPVLDLLLGLARPVLRPVAGTQTWEVHPAGTMATTVLSATREVVAATRTTLVLQVPLAELLRGMPQVVRLVAPPSPGSVPVPVPRRVRGVAHRGSRTSPMLVGRLSATALPLVLTPDRMQRPVAGQLAAAGVLARIGTHWYADDLVLPSVGLDQPNDPVLSLPVVVDGAPLATDRTDGALRWWVAEYAQVLPTPADDPGTSAYLFEVGRTGLVADPAGGAPRRGLQAVLRLRLRAQPSAAAQEALDADPGLRSQRVLADLPTVDLQVPYRVSESPLVSWTRLSGSVAPRDDGDLDVRVELLDSWARLAYEALATAEPQAGRAQLLVTTAYRAYVPLVPVDGPRTGEVSLVGAGVRWELPTLAAAPVGVQELTVDRVQPIRSGQALRVDPLLDPNLTAAARLTVALPGGLLELDGVRRRGSGRLQVLLRPELLHAEALAALTEQVSATTYGLRTLVAQQTVDVGLPCATHGGLYRQDDGAGSVAVGCTDALRLGEAPARQWREVPTPLAEVPGLRVLASLQQPGLFLVVPQEWRLARYGPDEPADRAYRPVAQVYSLAGGGDPVYHLTAALQPDLPEWRRRDLEDALAPLAPAGRPPRLVLPTDGTVEAEVTAVWTLPAGIVPAPVVALADTVRVSFSAVGTLAGQLLLGLLAHGGLPGRLAVTLPDGTRADSALLVDDRPVGPYRGGPVRRTGRTLTNRLQQPVDVAAVVVRAPGAPARRLTVGTRLAPGAAVEVALTDGDTDVAVVAEAAGEPPSVAELGLFAEDVRVSLTVLVLADLAARSLRALQVEVRCLATGEQHGAELTSGESTTLSFTLPLTGYLDPAGVTVRISTRPTDPGVVAIDGSWTPWDLQADGALLSVAADRLPAAPSPV